MHERKTAPTGRCTSAVCRPSHFVARTSDERHARFQGHSGVDRGTGVGVALPSGPAMNLAALFGVQDRAAATAACCDSRPSSSWEGSAAGRGAEAGNCRAQHNPAPPGWWPRRPQSSRGPASGVSKFKRTRTKALCRRPKADGLGRIVPCAVSLRRRRVPAVLVERVIEHHLGLGVDEMLGRQPGVEAGEGPGTCRPAGV